MDEEFLEDQIEDNKNEAASVDISFSPSNDNLNSTMKYLPKENNRKKGNQFQKLNLQMILIKKTFLMRTIRGNMENTP